jgi:hypothetical protein
MSASDDAWETPVGKCVKAVLTTLIALSHGEDWLAKLEVSRRSGNIAWSIPQLSDLAHGL